MDGWVVREARWSTAALLMRNSLLCGCTIDSITSFARCWRMVLGKKPKEPSVNGPVGAGLKKEHVGFHLHLWWKQFGPISSEQKAGSTILWKRRHKARLSIRGVKNNL